MIIPALIVLAAWGVFYAILQLELPGALKFVLVCAEMLAVGQYFIRQYKLPSELGLVLLKSRHGIELIERVAQRHERAFSFMADVGTGMSYGLLSLVMMRKNVSLASLAAGLACLGILTAFVGPLALTFLFQVMQVGGSEGSVASIAEKASLGAYFAAGMLLAGGLFLFVLSGVVIYGLVVINAIIKSLLYGSDAIARTGAGGTFLLPGINLPLFEGIIALAIVLVVHEGAHAVLARIARVPVTSSGIVLFGVIPIGAFVEPDERKLVRTEPVKQTRVLVGGPAANMLAAIALFALFMAFFYGTQGFREQGYYVLEGMERGTIIYAIEGKAVDLENYSGLGLPKNSEVAVDTNHGRVIMETNGEGKLGITYTPLVKNSIMAKFRVPGLEFIYVALGLAVSLNFVVGAVNILPIPLFDGYRIIDANVKNKTVVKVVTYGVLVFFLLNFLPLLFR